MNATSTRFDPNHRIRQRVAVDHEDWHRAVDPLHEQAALLDGDWNILEVNPAWERYVAWSGFSELQRGGNFRACTERLAAQGHRKSKLALKVIEEIDAGKRSRFRHSYAGQGPTEGHYFEIILQAFDTPQGRLINVTRYDLTRVHELQRERRRLGSKLLRAQDEERRRIARDLHDSTSQLLVALQLSMMRLKMGQTPVEQSILSDMEGIIRQVGQEIRAFSFLAYPPPLAEHGLVEALREMARGFASRTGLDVDFVADEDIGTPSEAAQRALYRLAQEAMVNVHRHAHARRIDVALHATQRCLHMIVSDDGVGLRVADVRQGKHGVGLLAMRDRLRDVGGRLSIIHGAQGGTTIIGSVPRLQEEP